jgi:hypothetical protein
MGGDSEKSKRKVRPGLIECDPVESALLVHYEVEEIVDGQARAYTWCLAVRASPYPAHCDQITNGFSCSSLTLTAIHACIFELGSDPLALGVWCRWWSESRL